ncbi:MAG: hypothetical protein ACYSX1_06360, partial [Planctomycetota bacterium]
MKQLLVALSILGMASTASAGLQISVGGEPHPVSSEIVLAPSDELIIDIWTDSGFAQFEGVTYSMSAMTHYGSLDWSGATFSNPPSTNIINGPWPAAELPPGDNAPETGFWGSIFNTEVGVTVPAGTVLVDNILFHLLDEPDATIWLYEWLGDPGSED